MVSITNKVFGMSYTHLRIKEETREQWDRIRRILEYHADRDLTHDEMLKVILSIIDIQKAVKKMQEGSNNE